MAEKKKIIALTTDPYDNIYGYALIFMKLFDYIQNNNKNISIILISNDGVCSKKINNHKFVKIKLNSELPLVIKTLLSICQFVRKVWSYNKNITLIANSEITELISVFILTIKFKKVYCLIQDLQLRDQLLKTKIIYQLRLFLIYRIKNVIFSNNYTMGQLNNSINKFYIGNPIF